MAENETWATVWVVMHGTKLAGIYGPIGGVYLSEEAALKHAASGDYKVVEWAASDQFHQP